MRSRVGHRISMPPFSVRFLAVFPNQHAAMLLCFQSIHHYWFQISFRLNACSLSRSWLFLDWVSAQVDPKFQTTDCNMLPLHSQNKQNWKISIPPSTPAQPYYVNSVVTSF